MKRTKNKIDEHQKSENQKYTMLWYSNGTDNEHNEAKFGRVFLQKQQILMQKTLSVSPMLRPIMNETSKTVKIMLVLYWGLRYNRSHSHIRSMVQYSTNMIFAVLDVSFIRGLNTGETDKVFFALITTMNRRHIRVDQKQRQVRHTQRSLAADS